MKRLLAGLCVTALLVGTAACALAEGGWVLSASAAVYAEANADVRQVDALPGGTVYTILQSQEGNGWRRILYMDGASGQVREGWIDEQALSVPSRLYDENTVDPRAAATGKTTAGFVLCAELALKRFPDEQAEAVAVLPYATLCEVLEDDGDWYLLRYRDDAGAVDGWAQRDFVLINPQYYGPTRDTPAYAFGSTEAKRVGLISKGDAVPIIGETEAFFVISLRGASAFVLKPAQ